MDLDMSMGSDGALGATQPESDALPSYFAHPEHRGILLGHIGLMVLAWVFVLPLGKWKFRRQLPSLTISWALT